FIAAFPAHRSARARHRRHRKQHREDDEIPSQGRAPVRSGRRINKTDWSRDSSLVVFPSGVAADKFSLHQGHDAFTPSTVNRRAVEFSRRCGRISWYSDELYQRSKVAASGNSTITMIFGSGPPSMSLVAPARARKRPPCFTMVSFTATTYGSSAGRLVISISTHTKIVISTSLDAPSIP